MIGDKVLFFDSLPSTNQYIMDHVDSFSSGDIVVAKRQTNGRGRRSRSWISVEGNLHASLYLDASIFSSVFDAIVCSSLAIQKAIKEWDINALIKYPNDVVVGSYKIAGILIERKNEHVIIGFGVNIVFSDHDVFDFNPGSIYCFTGKQVEYLDVLQRIIYHMNELLESSAEKRYKEYLDQSMVIGKNIDFEGEEWTVLDITSSGQLVITNNRVQKEISDNEITLKDVYDET